MDEVCAFALDYFIQGIAITAIVIVAIFAVYCMWKFVSTNAASDKILKELEETCKKDNKAIDAVINDMKKANDKFEKQFHLYLPSSKVENKEALEVEYDLDDVSAKKIERTR